jgi:predicted DNA-binding transcriptional regulator YafY
MNKTDRLLAIVLELQSKKRRRAEDLAAMFETSKRTIYRDIQALCEAGVPIISIPGQGYSLMQGYFLPPLSFNTEEATMLLLGSDFMAQHFDAQYRLAARSAYRKISAVLPEPLRAEVEYLQSSIRFIARDVPESELEKQKLQQLRGAIIAHQRVRFLYHSRHRGEEAVEASTEREADPYGLVYIGTSWCLVAYCHLRHDFRNFRLDRLDCLELLSHTFQRPTNFQMHKKQDDQDRKLIIKALFDRSIARWVREARSYYVLSEEECDDGLLVTLAVRQEREVLQWLLSWGSQVRVLEPVSLVEKLRAEAVKMLQIYQYID